MILTVSLSREHYFPVTENFISHEYFNPPVSSAYSQQDSIIFLLVKVNSVTFSYCFYTLRDT